MGFLPRQRAICPASVQWEYNSPGQRQRSEARSPRQSRFAREFNISRYVHHPTLAACLDIKTIRIRVLFNCFDCGSMRSEKGRENIPSTMCPTRRSIIEGIGDPASSVVGGTAFGFSAAFFFSSFPGTATPSCFPFFLTGLVSEPSALFTAGAGEALFSVDFGGFSFFFVSNALRSMRGAVEKSRGTKSKAGASASADLRTDGRDWIWSK